MIHSFCLKETLQARSPSKPLCIHAFKFSTNIIPADWAEGKYIFGYHNPSAWWFFHFQIPNLWSFICIVERMRVESFLRRNPLILGWAVTLFSFVPLHATTQLTPSPCFYSPKLRFDINRNSLSQIWSLTNTMLQTHKIPQFQIMFTSLDFVVNPSPEYWVM